jgi:hypothetical protein
MEEVEVSLMEAEAQSLLEVAVVLGCPVVEEEDRKASH